jgi:hypothetical protein
VSFVWGVARPEVGRVRIATRNGTRTVPVTPGHGFIAVFPGDEVAAYRVTLTARRDDGGEREMVIPPPPRSIRDRILHPPERERPSRPG